MCTLQTFLNICTLTVYRIGETETNIVIPVRRIPIVAIRHTAVRRMIVPATTADHTAGALEAACPRYFLRKAKVSK